LLAKVLNLFPGIRVTHDEIGHINYEAFSAVRKPEDPETDMIPVGVTWPRLVPRAAAVRRLQAIRCGYFSTVHVPYSNELAGVFRDLGMKTLLILRDPRDVVVSFALYIPRTTDSPFYNLYQSLTPAERLLVTIRGREPVQPGEPRVRGIAECVRSLLPWIDQSFNYTTFFHLLVGPQGGGSLGTQLQELTNIARHLGIRSRHADLYRVAEKAFGGTGTFRKGSSGDWRSHFSEEHKRVFKETTGRLLIDLGYEKDNDW
jgi:hypothetical protein